MNAHCQLMIEHLPAYLDGELPTELHQAVRAHLTECVSCHQVLDGLTVIERGLSAAAAWQPPSGVTASAVMRLADTRSPAHLPIISGVIRFAPHIAATAAVLSLGVFFLIRWAGLKTVPAASGHAQASPPAAAQPVLDLQPYQMGSIPAPVGRAFVIRDGRPEIYGGLTSVSLDAMPSGPAALRIDAFPREGRGPGQSPGKTF